MKKPGSGRTWHLTPELLRDLERGEIDPGVCLTLLIEHLAGACPSCATGLAGFLGRTPTAADDEPETAGHYLDRAIDRALGFQEIERSAGELRDRLWALPSHRIRLQTVVAAGEQFNNPALVELLLGESRLRIHESPSESLELSELAEAVARQLVTGPYGRELCQDRVAEARAYRANALRAQGELREAELLLADVHRLVRDSSDPLLRAEVASFAASLAKDQRRWARAREWLDEAERLFEEVDETSDMWVRVRLQRASILSLEGEPEQAAGITREVLGGLDASKQPHLHFLARHNLIHYLCEAGDFLAARRLLDECEGEYRVHGQVSFQIRLHWIRGKVAQGLGDFAPAEREYVYARDRFAAGGLGYDAALVTLDLATLYLEQGRNAEVRKAAAWTSALFESQDVHREALAALTLFRQAALQDALTVAQVHRTARYLNEVRAAPARWSEAVS